MLRSFDATSGHGGSETGTRPVPNKLKQSPVSVNTVELVHVGPSISYLCQLADSLRSESPQHNMVVTKKTPSVPAPPVSRTTSSQPTPRAAKGKAQTTSNAQGVLAADISLPGASSGSENPRSRSNNLSDTVSNTQLDERL